MNWGRRAPCHLGAQEKEVPQPPSPPLPTDSRLQPCSSLLEGSQEEPLGLGQHLALRQHCDIKENLDRARFFQICFVPFIKE